MSKEYSGTTTIHSGSELAKKPKTTKKKGA